MSEASLSEDSGIALYAFSRLLSLPESTFLYELIEKTKPECKDISCQQFFNVMKLDFSLKNGLKSSVYTSAKESGIIQKMVIFSEKSERENWFIDQKTSVESDFELNKKLNLKSLNTLLADSPHQFIKLDDFVWPVENKAIYLAGSFELEKEESIALTASVDSLFRLYIDGKLVYEKLKNSDRFIDLSRKIRFTKGVHSLLFKLVPEKKSTDIILALKGNKDIQLAPEIKQYTGGFIFENEEKSNSVFDFYTTLFVKEKRENITSLDWEKFYTNISGSKNPMLLYTLANKYKEEKSNQEYSYLTEYLADKYKSSQLFVGNFLSILNSKKAFDDFRAVKKLIPADIADSFLVLSEEVNYYLAREQFGEALSKSKEIMDKYPEYVLSYILLALCYEKAGNNKESLHILQNGFNRFAGNATLFQYKTKMLQKRDKQKELADLYSYYLNLFPENSIYLEKRGDALASAGYYSDAINDYESILKKNPKNIDLIRKTGDLYSIDGNLEKAEKMYKKALAINPLNKKAADKISKLSGFSENEFFRKNEKQDNEILKLAKEECEKEKSRGDKYVILFDEGILKILYGGKAISKYRMSVKILNDDGVREFERVPKFGTLVSARIIKPDGRIITISDLNEREIEFSGLSVGDSIDYVFLQNEMAENFRHLFSTRWYFATEGVLNRKSIMTISVPENILPNFYKLGEIKESISRDGHYLNYTFSSENQFLNKREAAMEPIINITPQLIISFGLSWDDFASVENKIIRDAITKSKGVAESAFETTKSLDNLNDKINAIKDFVAKKIKTSFSEDDFLFLNPKKTDKVHSEQSGNLTEKLLLMKEMLESVGVKSFYSLAKTRRNGSLHKELPFMQFNHPLLYIPEQEDIEKGFFIDILGAISYSGGIHPTIGNSEAIVIDDYSGSYNFMKVEETDTSKIKIAIVKDGEVRLELSGMAAVLAKLDNISQKDKFANLRTFLTQISGQSAENASFFTIVEMEPYAVIVKNNKTSPYFPANYLFADIIKTKTRNYDVSFEQLPLEITTEINASNSAVKPVIFDNPFFIYSVTEKNNIFTVSIKIKKKKISIPEFENFKKYAEETIAYENSYRKSE